MPGKSTKLSFITNAEKSEKLIKIAETLDMSIGEIVNEALDRYIDVYEWQISHIQKGVKEAKEENFAPDEEIDEFFQKYSMQ